MKSGLRAFVPAGFCGVVLFTSRAKPCDYQISPICRRKCGKSSVTVRNLPNDFGKKGGWVLKPGAGE